MQNTNLWQIAVTVILYSVSAVTAMAEWNSHAVRQLNGTSPEIRIPAKFQIVTESWNRVVAVPYIVYMPEKDRLLMLVSCDYPHQAMVLSSDDHGEHWTKPSYVHVDDKGKPDTGMGVSLTYLGKGNVTLVAGKRWFSGDYGATWKDSIPVEPMPNKKPWNTWDPMLVERDAATGTVVRLFETGYDVDWPAYQAAKGADYSFAHLRTSTDAGRHWSQAVQVPQWRGVSEVALLRAANGDLVAACRTDIPPKFKGQTLDHYEGLAVSISKDGGRSWSTLNKLYDWGRHHPAMLLMPNGDILMTYVVRLGYVDAKDGTPQFGVEAVVSHDNGATWDLDHRYILHFWKGNRKDENAWWASSQCTSPVLLPDGSVLTAFGTGYRVAPKPAVPNQPAPRDIGLVLWRFGGAISDTDRTIRNAPKDSDVRNLFDPSTGKPATSQQHR
jgi:hypothetical protein